MAIFACSIIKSVNFRGVQQLFANVYHYQGTLPDATQAAAIATHLRNLEGPWHSTDVAFNSYKLWSAGGSSTANQMIAQGSLSGLGTQSVNQAIDRERAVLMRANNGTDSRGRPVYMRKWYHCCGSCNGVTFAGVGILGNYVQIPAGDRATLVTAFNNFLSITVNSVSYTLCSPRGVNNSGGAQCHPYLEHHQLGDTWRG
jgi:hypothetical protein